MIQSYHGAYSAFTNFLTFIASGHSNVNSVGIGEVDDFAIDGEDIYPRVFLEMPFISNYEANTLIWKFGVVIVSQEGVGREHEQQIIGQMWDIGNDIIEAWKDPTLVTSAYTDNQFFVQDNYSLMTITRYGDDATAGVRADMEIRQVIPVNQCNLSDIFTKIS